MRREGGGAIRGSEKFAATPVTGMSSVTAYNRGTSPNFRRHAVRLLNRAGARFLTVPLDELAAVARIGGSVNHA
jgi:hypothetical protein